MKRVFIIIVIFISMNIAKALENSETNGMIIQPSEHPCVKVNLSPDQIIAIKEIVFKNNQVRVQDEANIRKATLNLEHILASRTSTKEEAERAQNNLVSAIASLSKTVALMDLSINYEVLKPEQRELGSLCAKTMFWFPQSKPTVATASLSYEDTPY